MSNKVSYLIFRVLNFEIPNLSVKRRLRFVKLREPSDKSSFLYIFLVIFPSIKRICLLFLTIFFLILFICDFLDSALRRKSWAAWNSSV